MILVIVLAYVVNSFANKLLSIQLHGGVCNSTEQLSNSEQANGEIAQEFQLLKKSLEEENRNWKQKVKILTVEFETLQRNYTALKKLLHLLEYNAGVYQDHLNSINTIEKQIRDMELCYLYLENYCKLKARGSLRGEDENEEMNALANYLDCKKEIPADYHVKIRNSFQQLVKIMLDFQARLINLVITGDFKKMEAEQQHTTSALAETCHFICNLEEIQSAETVFEIGWLMFKKLFT